MLAEVHIVDIDIFSPCELPVCVCEDWISILLDNHIVHKDISFQDVQIPHDFLGVSLMLLDDHRVDIETLFHMIMNWFFVSFNANFLSDRDM